MMIAKAVARAMLSVVAVTVLAWPLGAQQSAAPTGTQGPGEAKIILKIPVDISGYSPAVTAGNISCSAEFTGDKNRQKASNGANFAMTQGAVRGDYELWLTLSLVQPGELWAYSCRLMQLYNADLKAWSSAEMTEVWAHPRGGTKSMMVSGQIAVQ